MARKKSAASGPGVYLIYCWANSKAYVGSSNAINRRLCRHRHDLRNDKHGNQHLQNAWNLYGESEFTMALIQSCAEDEKLPTEQVWLDIWFGSGLAFNRHLRAESPIGTKWTDEERAAKSEAMKLNPTFKGRKHTDESRALQSIAQKAIASTPDYVNPFKGQSHSEQTKAAIGSINAGNTYCVGRPATEKCKGAVAAANRGRVPTAETLAKMSAATSGENNPRFGVVIPQDQKDRTAATRNAKTPEQLAATAKRISDALKAKPPKTEAEKEAMYAKRAVTNAAKRDAMSEDEKAARRDAQVTAMLRTRAELKALLPDSAKTDGRRCYVK